MNLKAFVDGINILRPFFNDPDGYHIGAEHDQFYMYATDKPLPPEEVSKMRELGWFQPDSDDEYEPSDGWSAFT